MMMLRSLVLGLAVAMLTLTDVAHCLDCDGGVAPGGFVQFTSSSCTNPIYISFFRCCYSAANQCYCPGDSPLIDGGEPITTTTTTPTTTTTTPTTTTTTPTTTTTTPTTTTTTPTTTTTTPTTTTTTPTTTTTTPTTTTTTPTTTTTTPTTTTPTTTTTLPQLCPDVTWSKTSDVNPRLYQGTSINAADCEDHGVLGFVGKDTDSKLYVLCNGALVFNNGRVVIETSKFCYGQITSVFPTIYGFLGTQSFELIMQNFVVTEDTAKKIYTLTPNDFMEGRLEEMATSTPDCENVACSYNDATMRSLISLNDCFFLSWGKNNEITNEGFVLHNLYREINDTITDKNPQKVSVYEDHMSECSSFTYATTYESLVVDTSKDYCFRTRLGTTGSLCGQSDASAPLYCETNPTYAQPATVLFGYAAPVGSFDCSQDTFIVREHKKQ